MSLSSPKPDFGMVVTSKSPGGSTSSRSTASTNRLQSVPPLRGLIRKTAGEENVLTRARSILFHLQKGYRLLYEDDAFTVEPSPPPDAVHTLIVTVSTLSVTTLDVDQVPARPSARGEEVKAATYLQPREGSYYHIKYEKIKPAQMVDLAVVSYDALGNFSCVASLDPSVPLPTPLTAAAAAAEEETEALQPQYATQQRETRCSFALHANHLINGTVRSSTPPAPPAPPASPSVCLMVLVLAGTLAGSVGALMCESSTSVGAKGFRYAPPGRSFYRLPARQTKSPAAARRGKLRPKGHPRAIVYSH